MKLKKYKLINTLIMFVLVTLLLHVCKTNVLAENVGKSLRAVSSKSSKVNEWDSSTRKLLDKYVIRKMIQSGDALTQPITFGFIDADTYNEEYYGYEGHEDKANYKGVKWVLSNSMSEIVPGEYEYIAYNCVSPNVLEMTSCYINDVGDLILTLKDNSYNYSFEYYKSDNYKKGNWDTDNPTLSSAVGDFVIGGTLGSYYYCDEQPHSYSLTSEGYAISKSKLSLTVGNKSKLKVINANESVTWKSNDEKVATVSNDGTVTGISKGTATVSAFIGSNTFSCTVTVKDRTNKNVKISINRKTRKIKLSTNEKGTIMYAFKWHTQECDNDGNVIDDGENRALWTVKSVNKSGKETLFSADKSTWLKYDYKTFSKRYELNNDYIFLYTCIKYSDGTYSDTNYFKIVY